MTDDFFQLDSQARPWLKLLDALENLDIHEELPIPQIAVFGDQSSGKSSLLESLSGVIFPKGPGLVTRCPTRISMTRSSDGTPWAAEISIFGAGFNLESFKGIFTSPVQLAEKLVDAADMICGPNSSEFSTTSINVDVRSPFTPNITLVDLPGIVRTTTAGQSKSVITAVDHLLEYFLRQPETVILAIIPANQDIATIDILERANKFDPSGLRTIGVLTKPDLIDQGAENEILSIINNVRKPLKLGYIMVKNRNQGDLNSAVSVSEGVRGEQAYFSSHAIWSKLDQKYLGIQSLCKKLTNIIISRAIDRAPIIKWHLLDKLSKVDERLTTLGAELPSNDEEKRKILIRVISRFSQILRQISAGDYRDPLTRSDADLKIKYHVGEILQQLKIDLSGNVPDLDNEEYSRRLAATISSMRGRELPGFGSTRLLLGTVSQELDSWRIQVETAICDIYDHYMKTASTLASILMNQFPRLYQVVVECLKSNITQKSVEISKRVDEMFLRSTESAASDVDLIESINNIRFSRFEKTLNEVLFVARDSDPPGRNSKDELKALVMEMLGHTYMQYHSLGCGPSLHIEDARAALKAYWRISEKRLNEDICTAVELVLLKNCSEAIESELLANAQLWLSGVGSASASDLVSESEGMKEERVKLKKIKEDIQVVLKLFDDVAPNCPVRNSSL